MIKEKYREQINKVVNEYIKDNIESRKYYYKNFEFFTNDLGLNYSYYEVSIRDKNKINKIGDTLFENSRIKFDIGKSSRNEIKITNINLLFEENSTGKESKYDYLTEYILYDILRQINDNNDSLRNKQKDNFLYQYFKYSIEKRPETFIASGFEKYVQHPTGKDDKLKNKIDNDEIEKISYSQEIQDKKNQLYIKTNDKYDLYFIFPVRDHSKTPLKKILEYASEPDSKENTIYYRGQSNSVWDLVPSISRNIDILDNEHRMFYDILSLKPNDFIHDKSDYEKLITMQHYGLPTRLLDLTRNPLISLYFACNYSFNKDGALYVIKEKKDNVINYEDKKINCLTQVVKNPFNKICEHCNEYNSCNKDDILNKSYIVKGIARNPRINNQCGDFIFVGANKISKNAGTENIQIERIIIIDKEAKEGLLDDLKLMNIHGGVVYPDLANMTKYIRKEYSKSINHRQYPISSEIIVIDSESNRVSESIEKRDLSADTSGLLYKTQDIRDYLEVEEIDVNEIILFLKLYDDDFDHKNSRDFLSDILLKTEHSLVKRNSILSKIKFDI